jgi:hypothetical protein
VFQPSRSVAVPAAIGMCPNFGVPAVLLQSASEKFFVVAASEHVNVVVPAAEAFAAANAQKTSAHSTVSPTIDLRAVMFFS